MKKKITQKLVNQIKPQTHRFEVWDTELPGFLLRVSPNGKIAYYVMYRTPSGRRARHKIGASPALTAAIARDAAQEFLANLTLGEDPGEVRRKGKANNLEEFLENLYGPWVAAERKSGSATLARLRASFKPLLKKKLDELVPHELELWRTTRRDERGVSAATINRDLAALKAALSWAVKRKLLEKNPLNGLEPLQERDSEQKVRYLSPEELKRLYNVLDARDERKRRERDSHNKWLRERGQPELLDLRTVRYVDHLRPMIELSLHTGLRRGELFNLKWSEIDFRHRILTVKASTAKSGKLRHIPLNETAYSCLKDWHKQTGGKGLVFPGPRGKVFDNCNKSWRRVLQGAGLRYKKDDKWVNEFRWHDMRHHFASKLVMSGVDLNTVRELLGHADIKMTLRYAHLAPEVKARAVAKLDADNIVPFPQEKSSAQASG
jgi:integrase